MMDQLVERFPAQLLEALQIGRAAQINSPEHDIHHVYVAGMGGSGIGADFVAAFIREECKIPYLIGKGYHIPAHIGKHTLCIVSSYSGNTEETLNAFNEMLERGCKIVVVASGGQLIHRAQELGLDYIQLPGDWPSPRACLGFSLTQQLFVLQKLNLISDTLIQQLEASVELLKIDQANIRKAAHELAAALYNKMPIVYTTDRMSPVAIRFRQQINENAKMLCWHHVVPEMNHNELVGWRKENKELAVVYFRNEDDYERNSIRIDINKEIISSYTPAIIELFSKGSNLLERSIYFVHLGDWASVYLAELQGVDAVEIKVIDHLKKELGKV